jgi:hypothetical protein
MQDFTMQKFDTFKTLYEIKNQVSMNLLKIKRGLLHWLYKHCQRQNF